MSFGNTLCGQLDIENPHWFGFVAGSSLIQFTILTNNCDNGNGLQAAILPSCNEDALVCSQGMPAGAGTPLSITYNQFVPGRTYYLVLDGWVGDVCDYEIQVTTGSTVPQPPGIPGQVQGPTVVCPEASVQYEVSSADFAGYYRWTAPPGASINGLSNNEIVLAQNSNKVTITFSSAGGQVCVAAGNSCSALGSPSCINVVNQPIAPLQLPPLTITFDALPFTWQNGFAVITDPGVYNLMAVLQSWRGCDSIVRQNVTALATSDFASGIVFWDANDNGVKDAGEQPYKGGAVVRSSSAGLGTTEILNGKFSFPYPTTGDTLSAFPPLPGISVKPAFRTIINGVNTGYDFGLFPIPNGFDLLVNINAPTLRPGFSAFLTVVCVNQGLDAIANASVSLQLPGPLAYLDANPSPFSVLGNLIEWQLGTMQAGETRTLTATVKVNVNTPLGTLIQLTSTVLPIVGDISPANNYYVLDTETRGSFDPNDKLVNPAFVTPGMLANNLPFEYTIRFQNTGNFPAEFVRVIDTLGALVDPASFRFLVSSHPCTWNINGAGVVDFFFNNIDLPDSTSNEPESHGFVKFSVKPKMNLPLGTVVKNFCDIYFDFNAPVRTNTAGTQVVYFVPGQGLNTQDALRVRPNPAALFTLIDWKTTALADGRIRLFDVTGLPRLEIPVEAGQHFIHADVSTLPAGLYFVVLEAGNLVLTNKLAVVSLIPLGWN